MSDADKVTVEITVRSLDAEAFARYVIDNTEVIAQVVRVNKKPDKE